LKILILGRNKINDKNWTHQLFLNSFSKYHDISFWGEGHPNFDMKVSIPQVIGKIGKPDLLICYMAKKCMKYKGLENVKDIKKVCIEIDFMPRAGRKKGGNYDLKTGWNRFGNYFKRCNFDLGFAPAKISANGLVESGSVPKAFFLPFSVDTDVFKKLKMKKTFDVLATFKNVRHAYKYRAKIQRILRKTKGISAIIKPLKHMEYVRGINQARIFVTNNNVFNSFSMKYTESLSCGTLMLANKPEGFDELGFIDIEHLVLYEGLDDMMNKIRYYLKNDKEREAIARRGMRFVRTHHSNEVRVKEFTEIVNRELFKK